MSAVAVVGAGIAGLSAARALAEEGFAVQVLERGRRAGGRAAHRRADGHTFDHGAQYFTARDGRFVRDVREWEAAGRVARWGGRIVALDAGGRPSPGAAQDRYVGVPSMSAVARHLARDLDVVTDRAVRAIARRSGTWHLDTGPGQSLGPYRALILAMPPEQAARLAPERVPAGAGSLPCWCVMAAFAERLAPDYDGAFVNGAVLDWIARDSSKPGRPAGERWVLHAGPRWSAQRLEARAGEVAEAVLAEFFRVVASPARDPLHLSAHRWSFARPAAELDAGCLWHADGALALCGDWCLGGRVEGAYLSGLAAAGRVAGALRGHQGTA